MQSRFCSCCLLHLRPWSFLFQVVSASGVSLRKCNKKPLGTLWRGSRHGVRNMLWLSGLDEQIRLMRVIGALWRKGPTIMIVVKGSDNDNANSSFKWAFFHNPAASTALSMATKKGTNIFEPWSRIWSPPANYHTSSSSLPPSHYFKSSTYFNRRSEYFQ